MVNKGDPLSVCVQHDRHMQDGKSNSVALVDETTLQARELQVLTEFHGVGSLGSEVSVVSCILLAYRLHLSAESVLMRNDFDAPNSDFGARGAVWLFHNVIDTSDAKLILNGSGSHERLENSIDCLTSHVDATLCRNASHNVQHNSELAHKTWQTRFSPAEGLLEGFSF